MVIEMQSQCCAAFCFFEGPCQLDSALPLVGLNKSTHKNYAIRQIRHAGRPKTFTTACAFYHLHSGKGYSLMVLLSLMVDASAGGSSESGFT